MLFLEGNERNILFEAYSSEWLPASPITTLAWYLRRMGGQLTEQAWWLPCGLSARLYPDTMDKEHVSQWQHSWRVAIRHAALTLGTQQRREFSELRQFALDEDLSFAWFRRLPPSRLKGVLAVVLMGGLLTKHRTQRRKGEQAQKCRCGEVDTEVHRFWYCSRWNTLRTHVCVRVEDQPYITQCTGLILRNSGLNQMQVQKMQELMTKVAEATSQDHLDSAEQEEEKMHCEDQMELVGMEEHCAPEDQCDNVEGQSSTRAGEDAGPRDTGSDTHSGAQLCNEDIDRTQRPDVMTAVDVTPLSHVNRQHGDDHPSRARGVKRQHRQFEATADEIEALPPHINVGVRTCTADSTYERKLLSCRVCGGVGGALARQFIANHQSCARHPFVSSPAMPTMTAEERRLVDRAVGISGSDRQSKRRRTTAARAIMVDTWR